jgi:hypothetical protein
MVPPPPLLPLVGKDDAQSPSASCSPTALVYAVCRALKACALLDWPLPAGPVGGKDGKGNSGNDNGNASGGSQELGHAPDLDGPPPPSGSAKAARVAGE